MAIDWSTVPTPEVNWPSPPSVTPPSARCSQDATPSATSSPSSPNGSPASTPSEPSAPVEPYLTTSIDGLTLTPHRTTDDHIKSIVILSNIPSIARWSYRREYPYERTHALSWLLRVVPPSTLATYQLQHSLPLSPLHNPFNVIRLNGEFAGDVDLFPTRKGWAIGYTVHPDFQNRGIATAAAAALIAWGRKHIGFEEVHANVEEANAASQAVVLKLGFRKTGTQMQEWPEYHGGGEREVGLYVLKF